MDAQKEALRRIVSTLANKNAELRCFLETVEVTLSGLQDESWQVTSQLEAELERLRAALEEKGAELRGAIREEQHRKEAELQRQRLEAEAALEHSAELLLFANEALSLANEDDFVKAARQIKDRVTMAPAFRLTTRPAANQSMACFMTDFSQEEAGLRRLHFLPVPRPPEVDASSCSVRDNVVTVAWRPVANGDGDGDSERIERYDLEFRKTNDDSGERSDACWERISDIRANEFTITGLKFDSPFISVRVRAANKAAAGDFCQPVTMETRAFSFGLDAASSHPELQVDGDTVSWQALGVKGHDGRLRTKESRSSRSDTPSPNKTAASRAARERFAGDSYTVLGDQEMSDGCHYWEIRPLADWKSYSVGVAYRSALGRFDQLGKSAGSWCLSAGQWLQSSLAAKHNNRSKALDWPLPQRIGVCCDFDNGFLLFVDVDRPRLLHSFRARFSQPLVPAFTVWGGGITVATGLQVPSFMGDFLPTNRSLTNLSQ